ncbi:hypothetical protein ACKKBG_A04370 [Auxenochlorella protothecoides x Auxenochlorella symbiontica]
MFTRGQFATIAAATVTTLLLEINKAMPTPYMDEVFHVGQTQRYCRGEFWEWDPKITTFPGLYLIGSAVGVLADALQIGPQGSICSVAALRTVTVLLAVACVPVFFATAKLAVPSRTETQALLIAALCCLLPTHFFFAFVYYTDVASTLATMGAYAASLQGRHALSAVAAAAAIAVRQTNAVWVAFMVGAGVLRDAGVARGGGGVEVEARALLAWLRAPRNWSLLARNWGAHAALLAAFAGFLVANGGVAVGDRAHHAPALHVVQLCYAAAFAALAAGAALAPEAARVARHAASRPGLAAAACVACGAAVAATTRAHPFLLADNRHYMFYIWRRLIAPAPLLWVPAYALALGTLWTGLGRANGALWRLGLLLATALVLVPSPLVEPRYFTVPTLLVLLHGPAPGTKAGVACAAAFAALNIATLLVMAHRPFIWGDGTVARFMW